MNPAWYLASWFVNFLLIAVLAGLVDRMHKQDIEDHRLFGAFLIFFLPVFLEVASFLLFDRPFLLNFVP